LAVINLIISEQRFDTSQIGSAGQSMRTDRVCQGNKDGNQEEFGCVDIPSFVDCQSRDYEQKTQGVTFTGGVGPGVEIGEADNADTSDQQKK
jgi:hypothetical protein